MFLFLVNKWTRIPLLILSRTENRLFTLRQHLHKTVIEQYDAVDVVVKRIIRRRSEFSGHNRSNGLFLFLGKQT